MIKCSEGCFSSFLCLADHMPASSSRYLYPCQLLIRHFWTPQQLVEFQGVYHTQRAQHHWAIVKGMESTSTSVQDSRLKSRLTELCSKVA